MSQKEKTSEKGGINKRSFFYSRFITKAIAKEEMKTKQKRIEDEDSITHGTRKVVRVAASPLNLCSGNENLEEKRSNTRESSLVSR